MMLIISSLSNGLDEYGGGGKGERDDDKSLAQ